MEPLLNDWITGVLRVPRGERLTYVHMGFGSVYAEPCHGHPARFFQIAQARAKSEGALARAAARQRCT
jgi:hypothetical protein